MRDPGDGQETQTVQQAAVAPADVDAHAAVSAILDAYDAYQAAFQAITRRAKARFETRDWHGAQADAVERLELYPLIIRRIVAQVNQILGERRRDRQIWARMKAEYASRLPGCSGFELCETFFNSVTRRIFTTVGVDPEIEFVDSDFELASLPPGPPIFHSFPFDGKKSIAEVKALVQEILAHFPFATGYQDLDGEAELSARIILAHLQDRPGAAHLDRVEILKPVFFRGNLACIIGRICSSLDEATGSSKRPQPGGKNLSGRAGVIPLVFCLANTDRGVHIDAVLLDEDDVSIVFSFTRSYFHVEVQRPRELVAFLKSIIPLKRIAELYTSIGYNKHGKTELYRDLLQHLAGSTDRFKIAPGERGMVMVVFSLDSYDVVFKVIKDKVDPPKTVSRKEVMERYDLVFKHDRAGRLVDAQEFEHLRFDQDRFSEDLLAELVRAAPDTVSVEAGCVVIKHLYTERRLTPLNLYVKQQDEAAASQAVIDYGRAIKDLAATNIFPGDVLLKNFGVTRHGRVVFYDYDELCLLTDCKFRKVPQGRDFYDDFEAEPWFYVGPLDIFPEEFRTFLGLQGPLRETFISRHEDLFGIAFWRQMQARHAAGELVEIFPYAESKRLSRQPFLNPPPGRRTAGPSQNQAG